MTAAPRALGWSGTWDPIFVNQPGVPEHHVARLHSGLGVEYGFVGLDTTSALVGAWDCKLCKSVHHSHMSDECADVEYMVL